MASVLERRLLCVTCTSRGVPVEPEVGIKAASVHYHFPTKCDIGVAVTQRYTKRFLAELGHPQVFAGKRDAVVRHFSNQFRRALVEDGQLCLCAMLGAETGGLPKDVGEHANIFFKETLAWLKAALRENSKMKGRKAEREAAHILAALEGGMIISNSLKDLGYFDKVAKNLIG